MTVSKSIMFSLAGAAGTVGLIFSSPTALAANPVPELGFASHASNYLIGRAAARQKDFGIAAQYYTRAFDENTTDQVLLERAFILNVTTGEIGHAVDLAERVIKTRPDHQLARFVLGLKEARGNN